MATRKFPVPVRQTGNWIFDKLAKFKTGAVLNGPVETESGIGTANASLTVQEQGVGDILHKTVFTFAHFPITITDEAGVVAYGSAKIYDFPAGAISFLGAVANLAITKDVATGVINDAWDGDFALGTAAASNNATLTSTEADLIPSTATPQAVSGATTAQGQSTATQHVVFDGTGTAKDMYLNFLIDDADHNVGATAAHLLLTGTLTVYWLNLGDY